MKERETIAESDPEAHDGHVGDESIGLSGIHEIINPVSTILLKKVV